MGLSKNKALAAAYDAIGMKFHSNAKKFIGAAQESGAIPADLPHAGTILVGEQLKAGGTKKNTLIGTEFFFTSGADWSFDLDAGLLCNALTIALLTFYRSTVMVGEKPDGSGAQKPLKPRTLKSKIMRRSKVRGYKTGFFADNIRRSKITGTTVSAQSTISPPAARDRFIIAEAKRGISYFSIDGIAAQVIKETTDKFVEGGMENKNRAQTVWPGKTSAP